MTLHFAQTWGCLASAMYTRHLSIDEKDQRVLGVRNQPHYIHIYLYRQPSRSDKNCDMSIKVPSSRPLLEVNKHCAKVRSKNTGGFGRRRRTKVTLIYKC